jgi:NADH-quinone oxidoreductase subunit H
MAEWWGGALFSILVWPGLLTGALLGWFLLWLSRKIVARLQGRQGPPFYQPFFDFFKLLGKKTVIPRGANPVLFYGLPILSLISMVFALALLPVPGGMMTNFPGDLILLIYLLEMPALIDVIAGFTTRSVYAQVGSVREALLTLAYNLPFISALIALDIRVGSFRLDILASAPFGVVQVLAAVALFLAIPARLKINPFSIPNAEQEIVAGIHLEFNGIPLALFELAHALEVVALAGLVAIFFVGSISSFWLQLLAYLLLIVIVVLLTCLSAAGTARLKVQHAFRFFWTWGAAAAALAIIAALVF